MEVCQASTSEHITTARALFQEYAEWLGVDLCFQGFTAELANLPGAYSPPRGRLLLALDAGQAAGCVALRPFGDNACEMKRLYVRAAWQHKGLGRRMAQHVVAEARALGYASVLLDTLPHMLPAIALYRSLGFVRRAAYYDTPLAQTVFMELRL